MKSITIVSLIFVLEFIPFLNVWAGERDDNIFNKAQNLYYNSQYIEAIEEYEKVFNQLGIVSPKQDLFLQTGDERQSESDEETDDQLKQEIINAQISYASCHLALGEYKKGYNWFEVRLEEPHRRKLINQLTAEVLQSKNLDGCIILVICEYGLGDTFGHLIDVKPLKDAGAEIILLAQKNLKSILSRSVNCITKVISFDDVVPEYNYDVYLMSLRQFTSKKGLIGMKSHKDIQKVGPYVFPQRNLVEKWLQLAHGLRLIGICWASTTSPVPGGRVIKRAIPLSILTDLASSTKNMVFSLQGGGRQPITPGEYLKLSDKEKEERQEDVIDPEIKDQICQFDTDFDSVPFEDTLAFMKVIEMTGGYLVSVDTSISNLAGAAGIPTIMLMSYDSDARWGERSPGAQAKDNRFYSSVKEFWQSDPSNWESVIDNVKKYINDTKTEKLFSSF